MTVTVRSGLSNSMMTVESGGRKEIEMEKRINFLTDEDKMRDFYEMDKEDFLEFYQYLTEEEYDATLAAAFKNLFDAVDWYIDESDHPYIKKIDDIRADYMFGNDAAEFICENGYFGGLSCDQIEKDKVYAFTGNGMREADSLELGSMIKMYHELSREW